MTEQTNEEKVISLIEGRAVPKPEDDQNTDDMVYGGKLNRVTFKGYGKELFANERKDNPEHPLNDPRFKGSNILIGGANHGCGSSREHAVQAYKDYGFEAVITAGYAGIFQGNCAAIGLVAVTLPKEEINTLAELVNEDPKTKLSLDLKSKELTYQSAKSNGILTFDIPEETRQKFITGTWDEIDILRANPEEVEAKMKEIPYFGYK